MFSRPSVKYLAHIISGEGVKVDTSKLEVVKNWPVPKTVKQVKSFLGFIGYYRKYIYQFAKKATVLHNLLRKEVNWEWTDQCQKAFELLRDSMLSAPILAFADMNKEFILTTDASKEAIGFVLSQIGPDGKEHPISYSGRSLRKSEKNWGVMD